MPDPIAIEVATEKNDPYQIIIGAGILPQLGRWLTPLLRRPKVAVLADSKAMACVGDKLKGALHNADIEAVIIEVGSGEESKNFQTLEKVCNQLIENHIERNDIILSFGGGAAGDLTGLAANLVRRGVRVCHIPTTLLSQTDSSIGGKTAINSPHGKNLLGTFYPPCLVLIDSTLTHSLPEREFLCGYAEIAKYGIINDRAFFVWLEKNGRKVMEKNEEALLYAIEKSCRAKAAIVSADEKETGLRALLNFGHTFGHGLESLSDYKILHGEAVSIGMVLAARLSVALGLMKADEQTRIKNHLHSIGLPTDTDLLHQKNAGEKMIDLMKQDKKAKQGALVLILARAIGDAFTYEQCASKDLEALFSEGRAA